MSAAELRLLLLLLAAGPGSGKTRVVAARVALLVAAGEAASGLLVITFTNKAAGELKQRLATLLIATQPLFV